MATPSRTKQFFQWLISLVFFIALSNTEGARFSTSVQPCARKVAKVSILLCAGSTSTGCPAKVLSAEKKLS